MKTSGFPRDHLFDEFNALMEENDKLFKRRPLQYEIGRLEGLKEYYRKRKEAGMLYADNTEYMSVRRLRVPKSC